MTMKVHTSKKPTAVAAVIQVFTVSYSTIVLYIRDHEDLGFSDQSYHLTSSLAIPSWCPGNID